MYHYLFWNQNTMEQKIEKQLIHGMLNQISVESNGVC